MATVLAMLAMGIDVAGATQNPRVEGTYEWPQRLPWAGEIFELALVWRVDNAFRNLEGELTWEAEPLVAEPWQRPTLAGDSRGRSAITYRRRVMALTPGSITLGPARQTFVMQTGTFRTSEYERAITESVPAQSAAATFEVQPLPPPPEGFSGAVGEFSLEATVEPLDATVGEPVTWSLTLTGTGNWPMLTGLPSRVVSDSFEVVGAPEVVESSTSVFQRSLTEKVVLIPRRPGEHTLRAAEMVIFDPTNGRYVRIRSTALNLQVAPGVTPVTDVAPESLPDYMTAPTKEQPVLLEGAGTARIPLSAQSWRWVTVAPPLIVAALWILLGFIRAWRQDPEREARRAHTRIHRLLQSLARTVDGDARRRLIRDWQREVGRRWKLAHAAPVPASFGEHVQWRQLWSETEIFLYGRTAVMPEDWLARARLAWHELVPPPKFKVATVFKPANLNPLMGLVVVVFAVVPLHSVHAQSAATHWQQVVEREPLNWRAHYNLAVTLVEESQPDKAAAHAAIAWTQQPQASEVRELWVTLRRQAGFATANVYGMPATEGGRASLAGRASPAFWQRVVVLSVILAAAGAVLILLAGFGHLRRRAKLTGGVLLFTGALATISAQALLQSYGPLASRDAVLVWRPTPLRALPVATFVADESDHLAGGSVGVADRQFLGWWHVRLQGGHSGWLRNEDLLWIWQSQAQHDN